MSKQVLEYPHLPSSIHQTVSGSLSFTEKHKGFKNNRYNSGVPFQDFNKPRRQNLRQYKYNTRYCSNKQTAKAAPILIFIFIIFYHGFSPIIHKDFSNISMN